MSAFPLFTVLNLPWLEGKITIHERTPFEICLSWAQWCIPTGMLTIIEGSEVQGQPWFHSKIKASLAYMKHYL